MTSAPPLLAKRGPQKWVPDCSVAFCLHALQLTQIIFLFLYKFQERFLMWRSAFTSRRIFSDERISTGEISPTNTVRVGDRHDRYYIQVLRQTEEIPKKRQWEIWSKLQLSVPPSASGVFGCLFWGGKVWIYRESLAKPKTGKVRFWINKIDLWFGFLWEFMAALKW